MIGTLKPAAIFADAPDRVAALLAVVLARVMTTDVLEVADINAANGILLGPSANGQRLIVRRTWHPDAEALAVGIKAAVLARAANDLILDQLIAADCVNAVGNAPVDPLFVLMTATCSALVRRIGHDFDDTVPLSFDELRAVRSSPLAMRGIGFHLDTEREQLRVAAIEEVLR